MSVAIRLMLAAAVFCLAATMAGTGFAERIDVSCEQPPPPRGNLGLACSDGYYLELPAVADPEAVDVLVTMPDGQCHWLWLDIRTSDGNGAGVSIGPGGQERFPFTYLTKTFFDHGWSPGWHGVWVNAHSYWQMCEDPTFFGWTIEIELVPAAQPDE